MTINKMEVRFQNMDVTTDGQSLKVAGYVNKTGQWSETLGTRKKFVERIMPGAFKKALQNGNEIHFLAEHDNAKILSTTRNGSLTLREDENGLFMEATISPTSWGKDYHQLITDGIIRNMSFGMQVVKDKWDKLADGTYQRSISDIVLAEVSAVRNPAYVQSTIAARSIEVVEDVEVPDEEKRELTIQEQLEAKKNHLKMTQNLIEWGDTSLTKEAEKLKGEIRKMETQSNTQTAVKEPEKQEERVLLASDITGTQTIPTELIREKAKKLNGKHSLIARTNIIVQKGGKLEVMLEDGENFKQNLFVGEMTNLAKADFTGAKVAIQTFRTGSAMEVSEMLVETTSQEDVNQITENKLIGRIEDSLNYTMLTTNTNMDNLNADASVATITPTVAVNTVSLVDVLTLISKLNQEYREGAVFVMHTDLFNKILINKAEFTAEYLKFVTDDVTGKKLYHLCGYPILVNDNANTARIIFGNLYNGYKTLVSTGPDPYMGQDIQGRPTLIDQRSFVLQKTTDTSREINKLPIYLMHAYVGGKVINKDCFARLDIKAV